MEENFFSSDGFTAANYLFPSNSPCQPLIVPPPTSTSTENREATLQKFTLVGHVDFLADHLGLGDEGLGPGLQEFCPDVPSTEKATTTKAKHKGRGRPRKNDDPDASEPVPRKKVRRTRIFIEPFPQSNGSSAISNTFRATKVKILGDQATTPHEHFSHGKDESVEQGISQPTFYYGSSPPAPKKENKLQYAYPYGLGLVEHNTPDSYEYEVREQFIDSDSLFEEFIDVNGGDINTAERLADSGSKTNDSLNGSFETFEHDVVMGPCTNLNNADDSIYGNIDDYDLLDIVDIPDHGNEAHCPLSEDCCSVSLHSATFQPTSSEQLKSNCPSPQPRSTVTDLESAKSLVEEDEWSDIDESSLSDILPLLDQASNQVLPHLATALVDAKVEDRSETEALSKASSAEEITPSPYADCPIITRSSFPEGVRERSPILGLSNNTVLRTCFRLGEALNCGCDAVRRGEDVVLELYARVVDSYRYDEPSCQNNLTDTKQHFQFADLFHDHGPFIEGTYEGWREVDLFEVDSAAFLNSSDCDKGRICRVLGRMRRVPKGKCPGNSSTWELHIISIWRSDWDDIEWVKGIVAA